MTKSPVFLRALSLLVLGAFFSAAALSLFFGMTMRMDGFLSPCPLMDDDGALCPISLAAHLGGWQELLTAQPLRGTLGLSLLSCAFFMLPVLVRFFSSRQVSFQSIRKRFLALRFFIPLSTAFSKGIIHSRLFA